MRREAKPNYLVEKKGQHYLLPFGKVLRTLIVALRLSIFELSIISVYYR
jgi:hypothetical protein